MRYNDIKKLEERIKSETPISGDFIYDYKIELLKKEFSTLTEE